MTLARIISFTSTNPFTNLAAEERLFQRGLARSLLFYVNRPCVVLGRTQNPFYEADIHYAAAQGVPIVRRRSGGGCVVHDRGNLNVCFISPRHDHDPCRNAKLLASVLRDDFGAPASVNKRGDILVDGAKLSGSAYRISKDRAYHHATLLVNSDLNMLRRLLKSPLRNRLHPTGTKSVSSTVANLADCIHAPVDIHAVVDAIATRWAATTADVRIQQITADGLERQVGALQSERGLLCSKHWIYGVTPKFSFSIPVPGSPNLDVLLRVRKGVVVDDVQVSGASDPSLVARVQHHLTQALHGVPFDGFRLQHALHNLPQHPSDPSSPILDSVRGLLDDVPSQWWAEGLEEDASVPLQ